MEKMKKLTLMLICCVMLAVLVSTASFAMQPQNTAKAETLKSLKIVVGTNKGFELDKVFTRAQGTVVVIKLLGMEQAAQEANLKSAFSDTNNHWAAKFVAYANKNGIVYGIGANKFAPDSQMTGSELTALILRGLGYKEAAPQTAAALAVKSGLLKEAEVKGITAKNVFLRDDMILVVYNALTTKLLGEDRTLLQKLVENNAVLRDAALASGLYKDAQALPGSQDPMDRIEEAIREALKK